MTSENVLTTEAVDATTDQLPDYELVLVISPEVIEEAFEAAIDEVSKFITARGGVITNIERWGKRRLAYPIRRFVDGSYVLVKFKSKTNSGKELESHLEISEGILRHLLIRVDD